jgi:large subunit ribosomal protein L29
MKKEDLKGNNLADLQKNLSQAQRELIDLRIQNAQRKLKNFKSLNVKRKEIARIKTAIRERQLSDAG